MLLSVRHTTYDELASSLSKENKIIVLSCNNCAKKCLGLGGRVGLKSLSDKLDRDGFNVLRRELIGGACSTDLLSKRLKEESTREWFESADTILVLACEDAEQAAQNVFPDKNIPQLNRTLGIGWGSKDCGIRLTYCVSGVDLDIKDPCEGISLQDAAEQLGLEAGAY